MRLLFTALACLLSVSFSAQGQVITYPYNPDSDTDSSIAVPDMLELLILYGNEFTPEPVMVDGVSIYELLVNINNTIEQQQDQIENLESIIEQGGGGSLPTGTITAFAGESVPEGWLICDGSAANILEYSELHNVLGNSYGEGDGTYTLEWVDENNDGIIQPEEMVEIPSTFSLPDLRGRVVVGLDNMGGVPAQVVDEASFLGFTSGEKMHQLTEDEMPSHSHNNSLGIINNTVTQPINYASQIGGHRVGSNVSTDLVGGDQPHNNMQPYLTMNYLIKY